MTFTGPRAADRLKKVGMNTVEDRSQITVMIEIRSHVFTRKKHARGQRTRFGFCHTPLPRRAKDSTARNVVEAMTSTGTVPVFHTRSYNKGSSMF